MISAINYSPRDSHNIRMIEALTGDLMAEGWPEREAKIEARRAWMGRPTGFAVDWDTAFDPA